jgi:hypothetical protein
MRTKKEPINNRTKEQNKQQHRTQVEFNRPGIRRVWQEYAVTAAIAECRIMA